MATEKTTKADNQSEATAKESEVKKTTSKAASSAAKTGDTYIVTVPLLNIRQRASLASEIKGTLVEGDEVDIIARTPQGFGKLADGEGYIKLEYCRPASEGQQ